MRKILFALGILAAAAVPSWAQAQPLTSLQLTQQNDATIEKSNAALAQSLAQQQQGQIEQQQREQQATNPVYGNVPIPAYLNPPPPPPPPAKPPKPATN